MIDLHCHILPGVDDGPETMEESIQMAKEAVKQGIHTIVATPHHQTSSYMNEKKTIIHKVNEINEIFKNNDITLTIMPGQEVRLYGELIGDYESGTIQTLNETNKYVLVEFPANHVPRYAESLLYDMQLKGLTPIIAHPERNAAIIERSSVLYKLIEKGALAQLTAASLTGDFGKNIKKFSMQLIEHNLVHMLASDAHNITNRPFKLRDAYGTLEKEFGAETLYLFQENVYSIIAGKPVYKSDPEPVRRRKLFGIF
ncbi:tyrosine-protein phosphatase [Ectobacillus panaciterrae]|uniref:tyrosine-protein phosphatase n=1 Tax=Ectobacillus panaciterrae TaxID=363872 RepID=UPI0003F8E426|nr:CpsB/CapC family capsule biosynthesis tyrosine phosphatase [Ectobacillus panaciterrae]